MHQASYVPAANISDYKGSMNLERKADLRKNHFDFADGKGPTMKSMNSTTFVPHGPQKPNEPTSAQVLKDQSFSLADRSNRSDFLTMNMTNQRWIQPKLVD